MFGSSVHGAMKFIFSHDPLFPTLDEVLGHFSENWKSSAGKSSKQLPVELVQVYEESGKGMIKNFYKNNPPWNFSVVDTESHFEVLLLDERGQAHILAGIIDRVDKIGEGEYEIIDYKTSRRLPSQEAADMDFQMSLYHMALMRRWPGTNPAKIKLSLYFLKHNEKISSTRTKEALETTKEVALQTIKIIEVSVKEDNFPPVVSKLCDYCPYKQICPAWKHLYKKEEQNFDEAQLQSALKEYFEIKNVDSKNEDRLAELQIAIKSYMEANKDLIAI